MERLSVDPTCHYCKGKIKTYQQATIDHVIPRCKHDAKDQSNWVLCCKHCNFAKANMDADEFMKRKKLWKK